MTLRDIERILYFESFVVIDPGLTSLERVKLLNDEQYYEALEEFGDEFEAKMGAEAVQDLMAQMDILEEVAESERSYLRPTPIAKIKKLTKRLKLLESFVSSGNGRVDDLQRAAGAAA